jgi:hypothetical protein
MMTGERKEDFCKERKISVKERKKEGMRWGGK